MDRRAFLALVSAAAVLPATTHAQKSAKTYRVGFLGIATNQTDFAAFRDELRQLGFTEDANVAIEHRAFDDPRGPAELVRAQPDVLVAYGTEGGLKALIALGGRTPIVFIAVNYDPIERGYVASLARPGANVTGVFLRQTDLAAKQVEFLASASPDHTRLGVLFDAISTDQFAVAAKAVAAMGLELRPLRLENPPYDFDAALKTLAESGAQSVLVLSSPHFSASQRPIAQAAIRHRLPTLFIFRSYVRAGGLISYGADLAAATRRAAVYVAKILNGVKPADLPVEQPTKFDLVINLKTAKALGITVPPLILAQADEVIE